MNSSNLSRVGAKTTSLLSLIVLLKDENKANCLVKFALLAEGGEVCIPVRTTTGLTECRFCPQRLFLQCTKRSYETSLREN